MQYGFYFDAERCIGCGSCAVACKDWNDQKPGEPVQWRRVTTVERGRGTQLQLVNFSQSCLHCAKPACAGICPVGAIAKRAADGIVVQDQGKCIGCKACLSACPFGVPQYGTDGTMQKCNLCLDRVQAGRTPACADACTTGALHAGPLERLSKIAAKKNAQRFAGATQPSMFIPASR